MVHVRGGELHGTVVTGEQLPDLIDEVPALAVAGACAASGSLVFEEAAELRAKESDRIETVAAMLTALGGRVETGPDSLTVHAQRPDGRQPSPRTTTTGSPWRPLLPRAASRPTVTS